MGTETHVWRFADFGVAQENQASCAALKQSKKTTKLQDCSGQFVDCEGHPALLWALRPG